MISQHTKPASNTICLNLAASSLITMSIGHDWESGCRNGDYSLQMQHSLPLAFNFPVQSANPWSIVLALPSSFWGQGRASGQSGIHFNDAVFHWGRMKGKLNVAFTHNAQVANDIDWNTSQQLKLRIGERLGRGHNNWITCTSKQHLLFGSISK